MKRPQLWYNEKYDYMRIIFPDGKVEIYSGSYGDEWEESVYSRNYSANRMAAELRSLGDIFLGVL